MIPAPFLYVAGIRITGTRVVGNIGGRASSRADLNRAANRSVIPKGIRHLESNRLLESRGGNVVKDDSGESTVNSNLHPRLHFSVSDLISDDYRENGGCQDDSFRHS